MIAYAGSRRSIPAASMRCSATTSTATSAARTPRSSPPTRSRCSSRSSARRDRSDARHHPYVRARGGPSAARSSPTARPPRYRIGRGPRGADLSGARYASPLDVLDTPVIGKILWARSATEAEARRFIKATGGTMSIYGHDVIPEGFERVGDEQIVVSTSFGCSTPTRSTLSLDLAAKYRTVHDLRIGHEILPLYPDKAPARLGGARPQRLPGSPGLFVGPLAIGLRASLYIRRPL